MSEMTESTRQQSTRPVVAVLDSMPAASRAVIEDIFGSVYDLRFVDADTREAKREIAVGATVLLTMWGAVSAETIEAASGARLIQKLGVGVEKIDVEAAERYGIAVLKAAGINADAVAELAVLLTLAIGRNLPKALAAARSGVMEKESLRAESFQLLGKTVGLLGFGHIGRAVARRLEPFGVSLIYYDLQRAPDDGPARFASLDEVLTTADVISLHLPSTPQTRHLINADALSRVKPGVILVNTARGSLIDEAALAKALADGRVFGAGLDVTGEEPLPVSSPLHGLDRVVITPHVGGAVANNFPRVIARAFDNAQAVLAGRPVEPGDVVSWPS
jgi:phosphoglycerate dehydrogenase-like enzyme